MIALFFEVTPQAGAQDRYLEIAAALRPALEASGGVMFIDRFRSLTRPGVLLSHQIWADEASLVRWRGEGRHQGAQRAGRSDVFADYRLRVGPVVAWRTDAGGIDAAKPSHTPAGTAGGGDRFVLVVRSRGAPFAAPAGPGTEAWQSVYDAVQHAVVAAVPDRTAGETQLAQAVADGAVTAAHLSCIRRDYGMFDRREAPQYFPPAGAG